MAKQKVLIVGGTSGLGLELARLLKGNYVVIITGRVDPDEEGVIFEDVPLHNGKRLVNVLDDLVTDYAPVQLVIYSAGFVQEQALDKISDEGVEEQMTVGLRAPIVLLQQILRMQKKLPGFIAITSTAQYTPRPKEAVYCAVKAGLGMFAQAIAMDNRVDKTLIVAPGGMQTPFWKGTKKDTTDWLEPSWVAEQIIEAWNADFNCKMINILRGPARVEVMQEIHEEERSK